MARTGKHHMFQPTPLDALHASFATLGHPCGLQHAWAGVGRSTPFSRGSVHIGLGSPTSASAARIQRNRVTLSGNVAYNTMGHAYFLEDGIETGNVMEGNLGMMTR